MSQRRAHHAAKRVAGRHSPYLPTEMPAGAELADSDLYGGIAGARSETPERRVSRMIEKVHFIAGRPGHRIPKVTGRAAISGLAR